ncbi:MAG: UPF0182 family protein [Candidatus Marinimicrobia bacterium]|nr:UPF0182 family protein [Candidatus Neomarinimicrobiota bacterium]
MEFKQNKLLWVVLALILLITVIGNLSTLITESWWFDNVGFSSVFWTIVSWKVFVWFGAFIIYALFLWTNYKIAWRLTRDRSFRTFEGADFKMPGQKVFNAIVSVAVLIISFIAAGATLPWWQTILKYLNKSQFDVTDPIFSKDIGFYFFELPFVEGLRAWLLTLFVLALIISGVIYFLKGAIQFVRNRQKLLTGGVKTHVSLLLSAIAILIAIGFYLDRYQLLYSTGGVVFGAGFTDVHATLISYWVMAVITVGIAIIFIISLFRKGVNALIGGIAFFVVALILVNGLYPWFQQQFVVEPNELEKERPYIKNNIEYTRIAYGLSDVERRSFPAQGTLDQQTIENNQPTVRNIRLWDPRPLLSTYRQVQEIRLYYKFSDVDIDRYYINGNYRQVMLSPRELSYAQVPSQAQTWQNQRLTYTHGYGLTMSPVNIVTPEGLPELFIKDIPPVSEVDLEVTRPGIYYGEETLHYVFTGTTQEEFDYPIGGENKFTRYDGAGGVSLGSPFRRLLYAYEFGDIKIFISGYFTENSKVHYHREIRERVRNIAPFLQYDSDPYITIINGELKWIIDAYTTSTEFPYSEPMATGNINYIRNSVKVVVDAYHGSMDFYIVDPTDPVIQTYDKIFPDLFKSMDEVPDEIRQQFRYPEDLFRLQSHVYTQYHMTNPEVFYNREDMWRFPNEIYEGNERQMEPYYLIMRLPEETEEEFLLFLPFTPVNKNNMIAWMAARSDGEHYGKLILYEFPKQELIYGPMQIEARIDQDPNISQLLTLWGQQGSSVIRGNLLVIPVEESLLYVEPVYLRADQGQMPELRRVIVAYENDIVMHETLEQSLAAIFGEGTQVPSDEDQPQVTGPGQVIQQLEIPELAQQALQVYQQAQEAVRQGDWAEYGEQLQELEQLLQELRQNTQEIAPTPSQ